MRRRTEEGDFVSSKFTPGRNSSLRRDRNGASLLLAFLVNFLRSPVPSSSAVCIYFGGVELGEKF